MKKKMHSLMHRVKTTTKRTALKTEAVLQKHPIISLCVLLGLLFTFIAIGNYFRAVPVEEAATIAPKQVATYTIGAVPRVELMGTGEKTGAVTIVAQSAGVVRAIPVKPGQEIKANQRVVSLSSTYAGASAPSIQRQIAQKQYEFTKDTYDSQSQTIAMQRSMAEKGDQYSDDLRGITEKSIQDTKDLIALNESIIASFDETINKAPDSAEAKIAKQSKASYLGSTNQLKQSLRNSEYQVNGDNPPAQLDNLQKDITLKQLEIQQKSLDLNKELSGLQYKLAQVSESLLFPVAPFGGTIERVFVRVGQMVNPGTPLVSLFTNEKATQVIVLMSQQMAEQVALTESSRIVFSDNTTLDVYPDFISTIATDGTLYSAVYTIPASYASKIGERQKVRVSVPLGVDLDSTIVSIPIEAVHENEQQATVFLIEDGKAVAHPVELGTVQGSFVQVTSGLERDVQVILDRFVIDGDLVEPLSSKPGWDEQQSDAELG